WRETRVHVGLRKTEQWTRRATSIDAHELHRARVRIDDHRAAFGHQPKPGGLHRPRTRNDEWLALGARTARVKRYGAKSEVGPNVEQKPVRVDRVRAFDPEPRHDAVCDAHTGQLGRRGGARAALDREHDCFPARKSSGRAM